MTGIDLIVKEREEQLGKHGYTLENDKKYNMHEMLVLIEFLLKDPNDAEADELKVWLTTGHSGIKFTEAFIAKLEGKSRVEKYAIAGAFVAAEIDRLQSI
jgi:hypothetical protein